MSSITIEHSIAQFRDRFDRRSASSRPAPYRRPRRGRPRDDHVPARRRSRAARGRAGPRQDDARAHARRDDPRHVLAHPVHARPDAGRHRRHQHRAGARARREVFEFQPGPIFANIVLADEINRATPKTQSALLEAMQDAPCRSPRRPTSSRSRSSCSRRRTRSRWKAPIRCPRRSSIGSSSSSR